MATAQAAAGDATYVNVLGADVGRQCLEAGLLDEILVLVAPVLLGDGTPLFRHPGGVLADLERLERRRRRRRHQSVVPGRRGVPLPGAQLRGRGDRRGLGPAPRVA